MSEKIIADNPAFTYVRRQKRVAIFHKILRKIFSMSEIEQAFIYL